MTCTRKNTIWDAITLVMLHVESLCVDELKFIDKNVLDHLNPNHKRLSKLSRRWLSQKFTCAGPPVGNAVNALREIVICIKESNAARSPSGRAHT